MHFIPLWNNISASSSWHCPGSALVPLTAVKPQHLFQFEQLPSSVTAALTVKHSQRCPHLSHTARPLLPRFSPSAALPRPKNKKIPKYASMYWGGEREKSRTAAQPTWGFEVWQQCPRGVVQQAKGNPQQCWSKH